MNRASRIEAGALLYEMKRLLRLRLYKLDARDREWCPAPGASLLYGLGLLGLMLFSGLYLYWDVPALLFPAAGGPLFIARNMWAERNPLLKDRPFDFLAACAFSEATWYGASLLAGFALTLLYSGFLVLLLAWLYAGDPLLEPLDGNAVLEAASLPMVCALFFLLHFSWERARRLRAAGRRGGGRAVIERVRIFGGLEKLVWIPQLAYFGFLVLIVVQYSWLELASFALWILVAVLLFAVAAGRLGKSSVRYVRALAVACAFACYGTVILLIETGGTRLLPAPADAALGGMKPMAAAALLIAVFLAAAWAAGRRPAADLPAAPPPAAGKECS